MIYILNHFQRIDPINYYKLSPITTKIFDKFFDIILYILQLAEMYYQDLYKFESKNRSRSRLRREIYCAILDNFSQLNLSMSGKRIQDFFQKLHRKLEMDCDDVDLPEDDCKPEKERLNTSQEKNLQNRKQTLANPFLKDFFQQLRTNHKSKRHWFKSD